MRNAWVARSRRRGGESSWRDGDASLTSKKGPRKWRNRLGQAAAATESFKSGHLERPQKREERQEASPNQRSDRVWNPEAFRNSETCPTCGLRVQCDSDATNCPEAGAAQPITTHARAQRMRMSLRGSVPLVRNYFPLYGRE